MVQVPAGQQQSESSSYASDQSDWSEEEESEERELEEFETEIVTMEELILDQVDIIIRVARQCLPM